MGISAQSLSNIPLLDSTTMRPIAEASIQVGKQLFLTDTDGKIMIPNIADSAIMHISHINYYSISIAVGEFKSLRHLKLRPRSTQIEEVVVHTGYQSVTRQLSTGAIEKINMDQIQDIYGSSILKRLEGNSSILFDKNNSRVAMTVRGLSSINNSNLPLIVVDNFPFEGNIDWLNPEDVADITILKDAASSAIWGTRAGNGVVVITTKKGQFSTPTKIEFTTGVQLQEKPDLYYLDQISTSSIIDLETFLFEKGLYNAQERSNAKPYLSPVIEHLIGIRDGHGDIEEHQSAIAAMRNLDVRDDFTKYIYRNALNRNYNMRFEGGGSNLRYSISSRFDENTSTLNELDKKFVLRSFLDVSLMKGLKLSTDIQYFKTHNKGGRDAYSLIGTRPYLMLADDNGNALAHAKYRVGYLDTVGRGLLEDWYSYPLTEHEHKKVETNSNMVTANLNLSYKIFENMNMQLNYRYEGSTGSGRDLNGAESYMSRDLVNRFSTINHTSQTIVHGIPKGGILDHRLSSVQAHNVRLGTEYNKSWGDFQVASLLGAELREILRETATNRYYGFGENNYSIGKVDYLNPYRNIVNQSNIYVPFVDDKSQTKNKFVSQYINTSLSFKGKYVLTGSARRDASNLFGVRTNQKWQPLWSVGTKWNISEEPFFYFPWVNMLALRFSYGISGNVDQTRSAITTIRYMGADMYTNIPYAIINQFKNPELRWERSKTLNTGMDFSFFDGKVGGSLDYYVKRGEDLFGTAPVDFSAVPSKTLMRNVAAMKGSGADLQLYANIRIASRVLFRPQLTVNTNKSEVVDYYRAGNLAYEFLSNGTSVNGSVGYPVYSIMAYPWQGLDESGDPVGLVNGEPSKDYNAIRTQDKEALVYKGSVVPRSAGFFNPSFVIGRFDIMAGFSFKLGHVFKRNSVRYGELVGMGSLGAGSGDFDKRWQHAGDEDKTDVPSFVYPVIQHRNHFYESAEVLVENADLIRFQNFVIGYSFQLGDRMNGKINLNATNLGLVWRANTKGIDPDYYTQLRPEKQVSLGIRLSY